MRLRPCSWARPTSSQQNETGAGGLIYASTAASRDTTSPAARQKPTLASEEGGSGEQCKSSTQMRHLAYVRLILPQGSQALATLIDSGADANIMDKDLARQLGIDPVPLPHPIPAHALDGHSLGTVTHQTVPIHVFILGR